MSRVLPHLFRYIIVLSVLAVAACATAPVPTRLVPTSTRTPTLAPTATLIPSPTPVPTRKPGILVVGSSPMIARHLIPLWLSSTPQYLAMPLILPALTWFDDKAQPVVDLATKVEVNADATQFTFTLPKNAAWSDGTPLTAKDVAFTYKLALDPAVGSTLWSINLSTIKGAVEFQRGGATDVEGIKIVNDQTIRFDLKESNAAFLFNTYLGILPAHILSKVNSRDIDSASYVDVPTVTAGPYELVKHEPGQFIQLKKRANYWGKQVKVEEILIRLYDDPALMLNQLQNGDVDVAGIGVEDAPRFRALSNLNVLSTKGISFTALHIDARTKDLIAALNKSTEQSGGGYNVNKTTKPYLADKRFRQALDYAIDQKAMLQSVMRGEATQVFSAIYGPDWAVNPNLNKYDLNIDRAKTLMRGVGVMFDSAGNALWEGKPITLTYLASEVNESGRLGEFLQKQLAQVGVRLEIKLVSSSEFLQAAIQGQGDLIRNAGNRFGADPSTTVLFYACKAGWAELVMGYCNSKLDEAMGRGLLSSKVDDRRKVYWDASVILNDELPSIFLYAPNALIAANKTLTGVKPVADPNFLTWNIQEWVLQK